MSIRMRAVETPRTSATPRTAGPLPTPVEAQRGTLLVQNVRGPRRVAWQRDQPKDVMAARETFEGLLRSGYRAYTLDSATHVHEEIKTFDPEAKEIVLIMPLRGGAA